MQIYCHVQLDRSQILVQEVVRSAQHNLSDVVVSHMQAIRSEVLDRQPVDVQATGGVRGLRWGCRVSEKQTNVYCARFDIPAAMDV